MINICELKATKEYDQSIAKGLIWFNLLQNKYYANRNMFMISKEPN